MLPTYLRIESILYNNQDVVTIDHLYTYLFLHVYIVILNLFIYTVHELVLYVHY